MTITVELLHDDARPPRRATEGSAGYDLCAYVRARSIKCSDGQRTWTQEPAADTGDVFDLAPGVTALVPLGFKARLPLGVEAQIRPRSGTTFKKGLAIPERAGDDRLRFSRRVDGPGEKSHGGGGSDRSRRANRADGARQVRGAADREWAGRGDDGSSRRFRKYGRVTALRRHGDPGHSKVCPGVRWIGCALEVRNGSQTADHTPGVTRCGACDTEAFPFNAWCEV